MNENIRAYINSLFEGEPQTKKMVELKEEMLQNLNDKYNDLLAEGKTKEAAYNIAVASVGDISGLIEQLKGQSQPQTDERQRQKSALLITSAVMLYILCVVPPIIFPGEVIGLVLMFVIIAIATGLIVYNGLSKPKYNKMDDTVVEEFREWKAGNSNKNLTFKAISSAIWSVTLAVYFIISFITMAWYITWVIFLIAAAVNSVLKAVLDLTSKS